MILSGSTKRNIALFAAAFLIGGILHVVFDGIGFAECFLRLYCGVLVLVWGVSVKERVTDMRLKRLLLWIASLILFCLLLQIMRYHLFCNDITVQRYLWYAHYAPMMAISVLCLFMAVCINRQKDRPVPAACWLTAAFGMLLVFAILTNDLHFWAFSFSNGVLDHENGKGEGLIYVFTAFILTTIFLSFAIILSKSKKYGGRGFFLIPLIPVFVELLYAVLYMFNLDPRIRGIRLWDFGEIFIICTIAFLEACIQAGMIPVNKNYDKLFSSAPFPAAILDINGNMVYKTAGAEYPFRESEDIQIKRHSISGGSIEWEVDTKYIRILTQKLVEANNQMEARNAYLAQENRIKQEKAELETRNRLYDSITRIVHAQISEIDELLNDTEIDLESKLPKISVLKAYIKRRSNMELLAVSGSIQVGELTAAVSESIECIRLCGANAVVSSFGTELFPAEMVIAAYEHFEAVTENCLDTLSHMNVAVRAEEKRLTVRMQLTADHFSYEADGKWMYENNFCRKAAVYMDGPDINILLDFNVISINEGVMKEGRIHDAVS